MGIEPAPRWEYMVKRSRGFLAGYELDKYGNEGWELVAVATEPAGMVSTDYSHYFKRIIK